MAEHSRHRKPLSRSGPADREQADPPARTGRQPKNSESTPRGFRRGEERRQEAKVYGFNACMTFFEHRPEQIVRGYFAESLAGKCGPVMKYLAAKKKSYHIVAEEELNRVTASTHHEGICLLVKRSPASRIAEWCQTHRKDASISLLALEGVSNPHNLGAIIRTCAHYGVKAVAIEDAGLLQSGAAVRTAEGGAEFVEIVVYKGIGELLEAARKYKFTVIGTSSHGGQDLFTTSLPARAVILIGEEARGLSRNAMQSAELLLAIPGTGNIESLNVSAATAVILGEFWRQAHQRPEPVKG